MYIKLPSSNNDEVSIQLGAKKDVLSSHFDKLVLN